MSEYRSIGAWVQTLHHSTYSLCPPCATIACFSPHYPDHSCLSCVSLPIPPGQDGLDGHRVVAPRKEREGVPHRKIRSCRIHDRGFAWSWTGGKTGKSPGAALPRLVLAFLPCGAGGFSQGLASFKCRCTIKWHRRKSATARTDLFFGQA